MIDEMQAKADREKAFTDLITTVNKNFDKISPELRDIVLAIIKPTGEHQPSSNSFDEDLAKVKIMSEMQDVITKDIKNQISDIERKNIAKKFKENWKYE